MIPQPSRRGRWLTICCGQRFWGRSKWGGRGWEKYAKHWKRDHWRWS